MVGVWSKADADAAAHQAAMNCVVDGKYQALALSPLASGRLDPPDIALFYATPGAMIYFINGLQWALAIHSLLNQLRLCRRCLTPGPNRLVEMINACRTPFESHFPKLI